MTYIDNYLINYSFLLALLFFLAASFILLVYKFSKADEKLTPTHHCHSVICPTCEEQGRTIWVIPGRNCPVCGQPCTMPNGPARKTIYMLLLITLTTILLLNIDIKELLQLSDAPRPWGLFFQDSASPQMEALVELHNNIMFHLVVILFSVGWVIASVIIKYRLRKSAISNKYVSHGTLVELIWTVAPGLILILIAFTSFKLLYLMDEVSDTNMTLYVEGHQWYWSYQYPDYLDNDGEFIEYDSYLVPDSDLENGALRMLDVDERLLIPEISHARFAISSGDVIHSYACPALAIKADAYPGRLNQASALINRVGVFYGQCSELCGLLHSSMPICIQSVSLEKFLLYLWEK